MQKDKRMCRVKICGLFREEDIAYANMFQPDYIGFVFWEKSKRRVTKEQARSLRQLLDPSIQAVGVFVDEKKEKVLELLQEDIIDAAQLHGSETEQYIRWLKERSPKPVIRMVRLTEQTDCRVLNNIASDYLLFDSGMGGGKTFDWNLLGPVKMQCQKPFFLAGGLGPDNVAEAVRQIQPYAVDMSSSLETDGVKDAEKIRRLMEKIKTNQ